MLVHYGASMGDITTAQSPASPPTSALPPVRQRLLEVIALFLKLGTISFGGPAAHIALMEQETVHKRRWLSREHFLDLLAATNLVPGPNATEMAVHIGFLRAGWPGLFAAGLAFILPAFLISLGLAVVYVRYQALPQGDAVMYGISPVVAAVVITATYRLGRTAIRDWRSAALAAAILVAAELHLANEVLLLAAAGLVGSAIYARPRLPWLACLALSLVPFSAAELQVQAWLGGKALPLLLYFLKVGSLIFSSGMVLFAFIQRDVVSGYGWLTQRQLLDAIAVGQMTPGPVLSSATFIGYLVGGGAGAVAATVGVFAPSFLIIALIGPWIPRLRRSPVAQAFLRGVNAAVLALIIAIAFVLLRAALTDALAALILAAALVALLRFRADAIWLVASGAIIGLARYLLLAA